MATLSSHSFSVGSAGPVRPALPMSGLVPTARFLFHAPSCPLAFARAKTMRGASPGRDIRFLRFRARGITHGPAQRQEGFTLLEVLVSFVIAALALGVLFGGAEQSLGSVRVAARYQEALSRARSHLAAVGRSEPLVAGTQGGDDGSGFRWRTDISPLASIPVASDSRLGSRAILYSVTATISWGQKGQGGAERGREVRLLTRRVGTAPAAAP